MRACTGAEGDETVAWWGDEKEGLGRENGPAEKAEKRRSQVDSDWKAGEVRSSCSGIQPMMVLEEDERKRSSRRNKLKIDARVSGERVEGWRALKARTHDPGKS